MGEEVGGFAGGFMAATQSQDQHQLAQQDLAKGKLQIQQTQQLLDAQTSAMMELRQVGSGGKAQGPGGSEIAGVAGQSYRASELAFAAGDSYIRHGLIQQGSEFMEKGAKLAESGMALEVQQAEQQARMWTHVGNTMDTVHTAQEWDQARMTFPHMFPEEAKHPEVQKFLSKPYDPQMVELLKRASQSAQQQAELAKTKAQAKGEAASARFAEAGVGLRQSEEREHNARAAAIGKAGGKPPPQAEVNNAKSLIMADYPDADPKGYQLYASEIAERAKGLIIAGQSKDEAYNQAYQEIKDSGKLEHLPNKPSSKEVKAQVARADLADDIDDLISSMQETPGASGLKGKVGRVKEFAQTSLGYGDQDAPLTSIVAKAQMIQSKLPKALTGSARSAKDERELTGALADITRLGTNDPLYIKKLEAIRDRFRADEGKTIKGKGDKTALVPTATGPGGKKLYLRDGKWVDK